MCGSRFGLKEVGSGVSRLEIRFWSDLGAPGARRGVVRRPPLCMGCLSVLALGAQGLGFGAEGLEVGVWGLGFGVWGLGLRILI
jgi:hypothetical protein